MINVDEKSSHHHDTGKRCMLAFVCIRFQAASFNNAMTKQTLHFNDKETNLTSQQLNLTFGHQWGFGKLIEDMIIR
jgi:hypothetical protein